MRARKIIEAIKEHYFSIPSQGLEGESSSAAISKLDMCAYYSLLSSLSEEELEEAHKIAVKTEVLDLWYIVSSYRNKKPYNTYKKNEKIDTILSRFTDKKSKKVVESRKEILIRFPYLSFSEQKKIVKAFLASNAASDVEWAATEADKRWDKTYIEPVRRAFEKKESRKLAITIIRNMPLDYVREHETSLALHSRAELCIRLYDGSEQIMKKYALSIFEYLYVVARSRGKSNKEEKGIEREFFKYIFEFSRKSLLGTYPEYTKVDYIPWLRRAIWALGELGFTNIVFQFLKMSQHIADSHRDFPDRSELEFAEEWIIDNYFPGAAKYERPDFKKVQIALENLRHPRNLTITSVQDLNEFDDLPPDTLHFISDFI